MKIIVAGSRDFTDEYKVHEAFFDALAELGIKDGHDIEIVSGGATGADRCGEILAKAYGFKLKVFPADWDKYGKRAGALRNIQMGNYADVLVAIRKNGSRGTTHMVNYMLELGKPVFVTEVQ